jgi:hypothetical protein
VVDARHVPVPRLEDDVHGSARELHEPKPEAHVLELLPRLAGLEPVRPLADPAVSRDEVEAEPPEIARLHEPHLARDEVVVEQVHRASIVAGRRIPPHGPETARMTTPPQQGPPSYGRPYYGAGMPQVGMPNPEFIVYVVALVVVGLVAAIAETVVVNDFVTFAAWITVAYFLARGLTKFGKGTEASS